MPYSEFLECWAYEHLEPFGERGAYKRAGILAALTANIHRDSKTRPEPFTPEDFIPSVEREEQIKNAEAHRVYLMMEAFSASNPGTIRARPKHG